MIIKDTILKHDFTTYRLEKIHQSSTMYFDVRGLGIDMPPQEFINDAFDTLKHDIACKDLNYKPAREYDITLEENVKKSHDRHKYVWCRVAEDDKDDGMLIYVNGWERQ